MEERNLKDAIRKAESLRNFREVNRERFERNTDHQDIVLLADRIINLESIDPEMDICEDDHTESW